MKTNLILLAMLCASTVVSAQTNDNPEPFLTKSLASAGIKAVFVNTSGGGISVSGAAGQQPRLEVYVTGNNGRPLSKEEAKEQIEKYYILDIDAHNGELHVTAKSKRNFNWSNNISISFKVYVPNKTDADLNTSGGGIHLDNLTGHEQFETSGGGMHLDHLAGVIKGETSGGAIHITDSKDDIDLETSGGGIEATNCQGNIRLETSGGGLRLTNLSGKIKAHTSGGSVSADQVKGELITGTSGGGITLTNLACSLDASTSAGSLHAQFKEVGKYVKLDVSAGHIDISLPAKQGLDLDLKGDHLGDESIANFTGDRDREHIRGKVNGGGSLVQADAGGGRVSVSFN